MNSRIRILLTSVVVLCSIALAVVGAIGLIVPHSIAGFDTLGHGLVERVLPPALCDALRLAAGLGGAVVGVLGLAANTAGPSADRSDRGAGWLRAAGVVVALGMALLAPGGLIPVAGYSFAMILLFGVLATAVLLVLRHPWWGAALIVALAGAAAWSVAHMRAGDFLVAVVTSLGEVSPGILLAAAHLLPATALLTWTAMSAGEPGPVATRVLRHRVPITVAAALCAAPYVVARASWLTPWPLLGPDAETLADAPMVLLTGLALGTAMLAGGLLTLGLIQRWGRRFPRWMAGLGGRAVPVPLVVVPASIVAALFTAGGLELVLSVLEGGIVQETLAQAVELTLIFPFWLWGPLLAVATWGYALSRQAAVADGRFRPPVATEPVR